MNIDFHSALGRTALEQLQNEQVLWMTTVSASGTPQPNLVWFLYDHGDVVIYTRPDAIRLKNIARNSQVSLNFNSDDVGGAMTVLTGIAVVEPSIPRVVDNPAYLQKYADAITGIGHTPQSMSDTYSVPIRIDLRKLRGF